MHLLQKATQLTLDERALASLYAYPDQLTHPHVRANMVSSIDGAVGVDGRSGGLGGPGDRQVFSVMRSLADTVIVGAATAAAEGYGPIEATGDQTRPTLAIVSSTLTQDPTQVPVSTPHTVVCTTANAPADRRQLFIDAGAQVIDCGTSSVDPHRAIAALAARGCLRILVEGGPRLLGSFVEAELIDELCWTVSPTLVGGSDGRMLTTSTPVPIHSMRNAHVLIDGDGFLFTRWVRANR